LLEYGGGGVGGPRYGGGGAGVSTIKGSLLAGQAWRLWLM
jgi:hypothetical protein